MTITTEPTEEQIGALASSWLPAMPDAGASAALRTFEALHAMAHPVEALTAMRSMRAPNETVFIVDERYATDAGYTSVEVLPIEHDMFRFYRLES